LAIVDVAGIMLKLFGRLRKDKGGLAAVEFAFVLPVMLSFFLGLVELGQALGCRADVQNMASIGSDLIAQESQVTSTDMTNVYGALNAMLFPFPTSGSQITISSIVDSGTAGVGRVAWSCTQGGTALATNSNWTLPNSSLITAGGGGSVILTQISYTYSMPVSQLFLGNVTWTNVFYSKPREVAQIPKVSC
jgi:Flp pilus assembly protein TadG